MSEPIDYFSDLIHTNGTGVQNGNGAVIAEEPSEVDSPVTAEIVSTEEEFRHLEHDWKTLLDKPAVEADVFQTYDWQWLWWKYFGDQNQLQILTVRKEDHLIGIAPFFIDKTSILGLYEHQVLKFIGSSIPNNDDVGGFTSYSISDYLDVIVDPEHRDSVVKVMIDYLGKSRHMVDEIEADELSENSTFWNHLVPEIQKNGWEITRKKKEICPKIMLPETTQQYLDDLDRKSRYKLRYSKRAVTEKDLFKVYRVKDENELDSAFQKFVQLHQKRWNKRGYPGIFANNKYRNFLRDVGEAFVNRGILNMSTAVDNDGHCIAVDFAFQFKGHVYDYQKAFDAESDLAKYSPGKALTYFLIDDSTNDGSTCVDLLRGGERYKMRFANHTTQNWLLSIPGAGSKNRFKELLHSIAHRSNKVKEQLSREQLLMKVHIEQWGISGFLPRYAGFLKERFTSKF